MTPATSNASHPGPTEERLIWTAPRPFIRPCLESVSETISARHMRRPCVRPFGMPWPQTVPSRFKSSCRFIFRDLLISLAKEHLSMLRDSFTRPALVFNALGCWRAFQLCWRSPFTLFRNTYCARVSTIRRSNWQAIQLRVWNKARHLLEADTGCFDRHGSPRSPAPFVIAYDDQGHPLASQAQLNGATPAPPSGVFEFVRQHGEERVSWQPIRGAENGVRIAAVVQRVNGAHPGFVLAGRNMREVETRIGQVQNMAGLTWLAMLGLILVGAVAVGWSIQPKSA